MKSKRKHNILYLAVQYDDQTGKPASIEVHKTFFSPRKIYMGRLEERLKWLNRMLVFGAAIEVPSVDRNRRLILPKPDIPVQRASFLINIADSKQPST